MLNKKLLLTSITINFLAMITCHADASSYDYSLLISQIESIQESHSIPGITLIIVDKHGITHEAYLGFADRDSNIAMSKNTIIRIGSITKTITALAVLRLAEQGELDLSTPISNYLKVLPYKNSYSKEANITVAQLLEHTAGFKDLTNNEFNFKQSNWTLDQSFNYDPDSRNVAWLPGEYHSYTNTGAGIAAKIIEVITHQKFEDYVQNEVFIPLNLESATFFQNENTSNYLATGYDRDGKSVIPYWHMLYRAFGALNIRADEMASIITMLINDGKSNDDKAILTKSSINDFETPSTSLAARNGLTYGYALGNYQWLTNDVLFHGHGGDADGYLTRYGYTRENNKGYFLAINSFNNKAFKKISTIVEKWLTQELEKKSFPPNYSLSDEEVNEISGEYISTTSRFTWSNSDMDTINIFSKNNKLYTRQNSSSVRELIPVNQHHYRRKNQSIPTISIVKNKNGILILQGDMGNFKRE